MDVISLLIALVLIGAALYVLGLIPMDPNIRKIIQVVVLVLVILWVIRFFLPGLAHFRV